MRFQVGVLFLVIAFAVPMAPVASAALLGTYEFTDNSLAITDAAADGISFSNLALNGYSNDEAFSDAGALIADPTLDFISLNGVESPNNAEDAITASDFLSFTVTNNSGSTLVFDKLTGEFNKTTVFTSFQARVYNTPTPASVTDDTISKLGAASGGTGLEIDEAILDGTSSEAGLNFAGSPLTLADGSSLTLYLPFTMNSNSDTRYMGIDNLQIHGSLQTATVPEPTAIAMAVVVAAGLLTIRRAS